MTLSVPASCFAVQIIAENQFSIRECVRVSVFVSLCAFSPHHDICQSFFIVRFFGPNDVFDDGKSIWWRENDGFNEFPQISQIINYNPLLMLPSLLVIVVVAHRSSNNNTNRRDSVSNGSVGYYQLYRFSNKFSNQIGNRCSSSILSTNVWVSVCAWDFIAANSSYTGSTSIMECNK